MSDDLTKELADFLGDDDGKGEEGDLESKKGDVEGEGEGEKIKENNDDEEDDKGSDKEDNKESDSEKDKGGLEFYRKQLEEANKRIDLLTQEIISRGSNKEEKEEDKPPKEMPVFITEDEHDKWNDNPEIVNNAFNRWAGELPKVLIPQIEEALSRKIPIMVANLVGRQVMLKSSADTFYEKNPELNKPEYKKLIRRTCQEVESDNPGKGPDWVFEETAKEVKKMLGIINKAKERETRGPSEKGSRKNIENKGKLDDLQKETLEDIINFSDQL